MWLPVSSQEAEQGRRTPLLAEDRREEGVLVARALELRAADVARRRGQDGGAVEHLIRARRLAVDQPVALLLETRQLEHLALGGELPRPIVGGLGRDEREAALRLEVSGEGGDVGRGCEHRHVERGVDAQHAAEARGAEQGSFVQPVVVVERLELLGDAELRADARLLALVRLLALHVRDGGERGDNGEGRHLHERNAERNREVHWVNRPL
mmetsp:Transcript_29051/g.89899  ORF Transcript_29051/g.89899 Transcript_29051/m.89899 type:complete len:211 (-) Transcript_29051:44-676(-)